MSKCKPQNLCRRGDGQFGTPFAYTFEGKEHGMESVFDDGFFLPVAANLIAGDTIRIMQIEKPVPTKPETWRVAAFAEVLVTFNDRKTIETVVTQKPAALTAPEPEQAASEVFEQENYVSGSGEVKWNPGIKKHEVIVDGEPVFASKDKEEAQAVCRGDQPIPAAA